MVLFLDGAEQAVAPFFKFLLINFCCSRGIKNVFALRGFTSDQCLV